MAKLLKLRKKTAFEFSLYPCSVKVFISLIINVNKTASEFSPLIDSYDVKLVLSARDCKEKISA